MLCASLVHASRELIWRTNRGLTKTRLAERMRSMFRWWNPEYEQQSSPRQVTRPMSKHQQNRFPRLAIVGPTEKRPTHQAPGPRWWGPQRSRGFSLKQTAQMPSHAIRMAVMPTLSRNLWFAAMARIWNFLRSYFVTETERRRGAAVLSFRRHAGPGIRRVMAQESFASKKPNGNVGWSRDCGATPQEGGRG